MSKYLDIGALDFGFGHESVGTLPDDLGKLITIADLGFGEVEFNTRDCLGLFHK
jgi:hypothetical protein